MKRNLDVLVGESPVMQELRETIGRVALSDAKVLIYGESGSGRYTVARMIHAKSNRRNNPYVAINCAGLPDTLMESELFGYTKGSFTGAHRDRHGKLVECNNGTVFLGEVGEMTPRVQGRLLHFILTEDISRIGSDHVDEHADVRIIAATTKDLIDRVHQGQFLEDLFYRLNVIALDMPPLRDRIEDIPYLIDHFTQQLSKIKNGNTQLAYTPEAMDAFSRYDWPGNVRELKNTVERLVITKTGQITLGDLPSEIQHPHGKQPNDSSSNLRIESRITIAGELYRRITTEGESFWATVYPLYMQREITKHNVREVVKKGLEEARGNYKIVARLFNIPANDYKRFMNFLRKHECQPPFKDYRI